MQRHAQRSYNKSKLTDLRQTETALHGRLQRLPRQQHPQRPEEGLSENDRQSNHDNRSRILHNHSRVYHHADRYEKDGAKQVLDRLHQALYALRLYRSARMEPMINAPKAAENPVCAAITTIPKQSPRETISKVSSLINFRHRFSNPGMR